MLVMIGDFDVKYSMRTLLLLLVLLLPTCATTSTPAPVVEGVGKVVTIAGGYYTDVSPADLKTMLASQDFILDNVHIPFVGNISKTDLSIAYD
jgi:hypothetical protein